MKAPCSLQTRRDFLRTGVLGGALGWTVPAFLSHTFSALHAEAADASTQTASGKDSAILVVLQMAGGNDGLNTVVPYASDDYHKGRPRIGLPAKSVLKINDHIGLHPSLDGFKSLYDAGHLSIIQGVGYPNPNRSHFRSTEIWQTASDAAKVESYGWLGRYFDNACAGADATVGVNIGKIRKATVSTPGALPTAKSMPTKNPSANSTSRRRRNRRWRIPARASEPLAGRWPIAARCWIFWSARRWTRS
jgi:uncharacterized protein (DUF1501 family)